jgi:hypothetical protein
LKKLLFIALFSLFALCPGQGIQGIYRMGNTIYRFSADSFKSIFPSYKYRYGGVTLSYDTLTSTAQGGLALKKDKLVLGAAIGHPKAKYIILSYTDSGIHCHLKGQKKYPLFFRKTDMPQHEFDSIYSLYKSKRIYWHRGMRRKFPKTKLVLYNPSSKKTKRLVQKKTLHFTRFYTDTFAGRLDTFRQEIYGYADSVGDSLVFIKAYRFFTDNYYSFPDRYEFVKYKPNLHSEWYDYYSDTIMAVPKNELYRLTFYDHSGDHTGALVAGIMNTLLMPFYSINYDTYKVNKTAARNGLFISAGFFILAITDKWIVPAIRDYYLAPSPGTKVRWSLLRVEK